MSDTECNPIRDAMLRQAILQAAPDNTTLAAVAAFLPGDFDADEGELADMLARMAPEQAIEFEGVAEPTPPQESVLTVADPSASAEPVKEPPALTFAEARDMVMEWGNKLSAARGRLMAAQSRQQAGRLKLAAAIGQFIAGFPKLTREGLQRQYLASEAERRQRVADGLEPPTGGTRQAPTGALTRGAFYRRGGGINQGHGNKHIKKAASLIAQQQAAGLKPSVGATKVPSAR